MIVKCRACYGKELETILSLGKFYLSDFVKSNKKPPKYPLTLVLCKKCHLLQLGNTAPPTLLYTDHYGYRSGINTTMQNELRDIVKKSLEKITRKNQCVAVDIGANDGTLLKFYPKSYVRIAIEPVKKLAKEAEKYASILINDFFNANSYKKRLGRKRADIITAISCFYDIDDPNTFLNDITKILSKNGVFVIQQNYLATMLNYNAFDNIVHEHLEYYSLSSLQKLLKKHNLEAFDVELSDINGGSFRTYISFRNKQKIKKSVKQLLLSEKSMKLNERSPYLQFAKRVKKNKNKLLSFIKDQTEKGKRVYVYGASTRGNTLLQYCGLTYKLIPYAIERNKEKWGTKIASVNIPIISEEQARIDKPDYMLVLPWFFREEFLKREREYLKQGGHFIFPLPTFEVI